MEYNFGEKVEQLLTETGKTKKSLYDHLKMTANGFDAMIKNNSISAVRLAQIADFFKVSVPYFYGTAERTSNKSEDGGAFGAEVIQLLNARIEELKDQVATQKYTINLQRQMLEQSSTKVGLGKSEGAIERPLSTPLSFEETMRQYRQTVMGQMPKSSFFLVPLVAKPVAPRSFV